MTIAEFTETLSRGLGLDIHHQQITWDSFENEAGEEIAVMQRWFDEKGYDVDVEALRLRYPDLLTYAQYLETLDWL